MAVDKLRECKYNNSLFITITKCSNVNLKVIKYVNNAKPLVRWLEVEYYVLGPARVIYVTDTCRQLACQTTQILCTNKSSR